MEERPLITAIKISPEAPSKHAGGTSSQMYPRASKAARLEGSFWRIEECKLGRSWGHSFRGNWT